MSKRILVIENDAPIRSAVERALRQNGYEVISVDSAKRAEGVLAVSEFDLAVIGAGIKTIAGTPLYSEWTNQQAKRGPVLVIYSDRTPRPDLPDEAIVESPFMPDELISKIAVFAGNVPSGSTEEEEFFCEKPLDDDALDAALGLDRIEVQESELRNATGKIQLPPKTKTESMIGYDAEITATSRHTEKSLTDTARIDLALQSNKTTMQKQSETIASKDDIEVATPGAIVNPGSESESHDYSWFESEMKESGQIRQVAKPETAKTPPANPAPAPPTTPAPPATPEKISPASEPDGDVFNWSGDGDSVSKDLVKAIAGSVAEQLLKRLDTDKFHKLIEKEIRDHLAKKSG